VVWRTQITGQHGTRIEIRSAGAAGGQQGGAAAGAVEGSSPPQPMSTLAVRSGARLPALPGVHYASLLFVVRVVSSCAS
jgi:hypothetical protein